jgi:hypothetical protein
MGLLAVALGAVVLVGPAIDDAAAKKAKIRFTAQVDGKPLKGAKRQVVFINAGTSFSVTGQTKVRRGAHRALTAACSGNLASLALPATLDCYGDYGEYSRTGLKSWTGLQIVNGYGLQVTIESFDGSRVVGMLRGTLASTTSSDPPVTIENGSFSAVVQ